MTTTANFSDNFTETSVLKTALETASKTTILITLIAICLSLATGQLFIFLSRCRKDQYLPLNSGAFVLLVAVSIGAIIEHGSQSKWTFANYTPRSNYMLIYHICGPLLTMYSSYIMPAHLLTCRSILSISLYAMASALLPSFALAACYHGLANANMHMLIKGIPWGTTYLATAFMLGTGALMGESVAVHYELKDLGRSGDVLLFLEGEFLITATAAGIFQNLIQHPLIWALMNLVSFPLAIFMGEFTLYILHALYRNKYRDLLVFSISVYLTHAVAEVGKFSGVWTVIILGVYFSLNKVNICVESLQLIEDVYRTMYYGATHLVYFFSGIEVGRYLYEYPEVFRESGHICLVALICFVLRIFGVASGYFLRTFLLFENASSRLLEITKIIGNISGPLSLLIGLAYLEILEPAYAKHHFLYLTSVVLFSLLIKGSLFPLILHHMNIEQFLNRKKHLHNLKNNMDLVQWQEMHNVTQDRLLSEARWDLVQDALRTYSTSEVHQTPETNVSPDWIKQLLTRLDSGSKDLALSGKYHQDIRIALLQSHFISYVRQVNDGQLSLWAARVLQTATEVAINGQEEVVSVSVFKAYSHVNTCWSCLEKLFARLQTHLKIKEEKHPPAPKSSVCLLFYKLDHSILFETFVYLVLLSHMILTFFEIQYYIEKDPDGPPYGFSIANKAFYGFYVLEFVIKLTALGRHVFHTKWNYLDLVFAVISAIDLIFEIFAFNLMKKHGIDHVVRYMQAALIFIRLLKLIRFVKILIPFVVYMCEEQLNRQVSRSYEILRGILCAEEDTIRIIHFKVADILDQEKPGEETPDLAEEIEAYATEFLSSHKENRTEAIRSLGHLSVEHSRVISSVKSRKAITYLSQCLRRKVDEWKQWGEIDVQEYEYLRSLITNRESEAIKTIKPCIAPPGLSEILDSMAWVKAGGQEGRRFILEKGSYQTVKEGTIICKQGAADEKGLFIVISGLLRVKMSIRGSTIFEEYFGTGNFLGEMNALTGEVRSAQVEADTVSELFNLPQNVCQQIFNKFPGVRLEMIKTYCIRKVYTDILNKDRRYESWTEARVKAAMANGRVLDLLAQPSGEVSKKANIEVVYLTRGVVSVDRLEESKTPRGPYVLTAQNKCLQLPHACTKILVPHKELIPRDRNIWLFVMPISIEQFVGGGQFLVDQDGMHAGTTVTAEYIQKAKRESIDGMMSPRHLFNPAIPAADNGDGVLKGGKMSPLGSGTWGDRSQSVTSRTSISTYGSDGVHAARLRKGSRNLMEMKKRYAVPIISTGSEHKEKNVDII